MRSSYLALFSPAASRREWLFRYAGRTIRPEVAIVVVAMRVVQTAGAGLASI